MWKLIFHHASRNNICHPFKNGKARDDWFSRFQRRHPVICSAERDQMLIVICCCNAAGTFCSTHCHFCLQTHVRTTVAPQGLPVTVTTNGWILSENCSTQARLVLLLLDNHQAHKYHSALEYATEKQVTLFVFRTTHDWSNITSRSGCYRGNTWILNTIQMHNNWERERDMSPKFLPAFLVKQSANLEGVDRPTSAANLTPLQIRPIQLITASKTGRQNKMHK